MADLDQDFKELVDSVKDLYSLRNNPTPAAQMPKGDGTYQAPVRGSWKSSGGFSFQATDARHPKGHMGVDIRAPGGTAVYPITDGLVTNVGTDPKGGNIVNVQHADGVRSYYAHLGTIQVQKGDKITKESVLGTIGESGNAAGTVPHCHFQVWKDGQIRNPADFFSVPAYEAMGKTEKRWLDGAESVAKNWSLRDHLAGKPGTAVASNLKIELIVRACSAYERVLCRS